MMPTYQKNLYLVFLLFVLFPQTIISLYAQESRITKDNIKFIQYPGFPSQHSTWNDIGYSTYHNKVFIGVTNHHNKIALFEYDVAGEEMKNKGFIDLNNYKK